MLIIAHRKNTIEDLEKTPNHMGVEIDLRPEGHRLILNHDPFVPGVDFEEWLTHYKHKLLVANIKSEGIEERVIKVLEHHGVKDYFLLDQSQPFLIKYARNGFRKTAVRFSEMEPIEMALKFAGMVDWVFVDNTTKIPVEDNAFEKLRKHFKVCIVSPELLGRWEDIPLTKEAIRKHPVDAVLTKDIVAWSE